MNYILLICSDDKLWEAAGQEALQTMYAEHTAYGKALAEAGVLRGGAELKPASTATTLRSANGKTTMVDGPFAETKEQLGGFYLIEADSIDIVLDLCRILPPSYVVEVRPVVQIEGYEDTRDWE